MLTIKIPGEEAFNSELQEFVYGSDTVLELEHSLASISKWESFWKKPFLGKDEKSPEEILSYIEFMVLTTGDHSKTLTRLNEENYDQINKYIGQEMTATWFSENAHKPSTNREIITSEIVYYWMFSLQLPLECENWHFNKLTTLIKVMNLKNQPKKKMSQREVIEQQRALNQKRRQEMAG